MMMLLTFWNIAIYIYAVGTTKDTRYFIKAFTIDLYAVSDKALAVENFGKFGSLKPVFQSLTAS